MSIADHENQRYTYRVLQTIQMKLILLCVWPDPAILGCAKTALKFKYNIYKYRTRAIITRSWFETALNYKPRILDSKNEELPLFST